MKSQNIHPNNLLFISQLGIPPMIGKHFAELCMVPRESGNEALVIDDIALYAQQNNRQTVRDAMHNLLVRVPATKKFEHVPSVCIQVHVDIVCAKDAGIESVFPIELMLNAEGLLTANGTTLGGDNALGVAMAKTLIASSDIPHGPLELLFFTQEEIGLKGAEAFDYRQLRSKKIINLDGEEFGELYVGCLGGVRINAKLTPEYSIITDRKFAYEISLSGLRGGHSGIDVHDDSNRANAIRIMANIIRDLDAEIGCGLCELTGGTAMNAIPPCAKAVILVSPSNREKFIFTFSLIKRRLLEELDLNEQNVKLDYALLRSSDDRKVFTAKWKEQLFGMLALIPERVIERDATNGNIAQTSNTLTLIQMEEDCMKITCLCRSSDVERLTFTERSIRKTLRMCTSDVQSVGKYLPWAPKFGTALENVAIAAYKRVTGQDAQVKVMPAGLECAFFSLQMPNDTQIISFGPTIRAVHTTSEYADQKTIGPCFDVLKEILLTV